MSRIAYVLTQDKGGPVDVTVRLASTLHRSGAHDVMLFGPTPARDHHLLTGIHTPMSVSSKGNVAEARRLRAEIRAWRPDVVHAQDRRSGLVTSSMQRLPRGPRAVLHTYHGVPDDVEAPWFTGQRSAPGPSRRTKAVLAADAFVARQVTRTLVPSTAMVDFLADRLRVPRHRMAHVDNGVLLPSASPPAGPVRKLLFVGLLIPRKGLTDLLTALSMPGNMPADATLTVAGDGPQRAEAEAMADGGPLAGRVEFLGFRTDVTELVGAHDALVLPSRMEQQPLVIAEAMGAGKPVLATDVGGVAEMLAVPSAAGYVAPPGDIPKLGASLRGLFADPDPAALGRSLACRARERYSAEACAAAHLAIYRSVLT